MSTRELTTAVASIQQADAAMPTDLDGMRSALGDLDDLLGVLSSYGRRLSTAVEDLPGSATDLRVNQMDGPVAPEFVCNQVAIHLQAAAAGIDQAQTAVSVALRLSERLHTRAY
jgi:hypothetical protein